MCKQSRDCSICLKWLKVDLAIRGAIMEEEEVIHHEVVEDLVVNLPHQAPMKTLVKTKLEEMVAMQTNNKILVGELDNSNINKWKPTITFIIQEQQRQDTLPFQQEIFETALPPFGQELVLQEKVLLQPQEVMVKEAKDLQPRLLVNSLPI